MHEGEHRNGRAPATVCGDHLRSDRFFPQTRKFMVCLSEKLSLFSA
jgi:hypothetical protein